MTSGSDYGPKRGIQPPTPDLTLHKTDVILPDDMEAKRQANAKYQRAFRTRHSLLIADLQKRQRDLIGAAEIIEQLGNMTLGRRLRKAAEDIGDL